LDPKVRLGKDLAGVVRWFFGGWEGDDGGCQTSPKLIMLDDDTRKALREGKLAYSDLCDSTRQINEAVVKASHLALDFWDRAGFHMKFVFAEKRATMVGWHLHLRLSGDFSTVPSGLMCPELPRAVKMNASTSRVCIDAMDTGDLRGFKLVAAAANLARAADFAGLLPTVSQKYLQYADQLNDGNFEDRELAMRVEGEVGIKADSVREQIYLANAAVSPLLEEARRELLGYTASEEELQAFKHYVWTLEGAADYDKYAASLPASWRVEGSI
jgi:hypothetical protein